MGDPIDVVVMEDGKYTTIDNTRLYAAEQTGNDVEAYVHNYNDPLTAAEAERFTTTKNGKPSTWGEAIEYRINKQNSSYRNSYPNGSEEMPNPK